jgi:hypothetical protein
LIDGRLGGADFANTVDLAVLKRMTASRMGEPRPAVTLRRVLSLLLVLFVTTISPHGRAEGWLTNGVFALGTGLQGGDPGSGSVEWARARTRIISGVDLRSDESLADGVGFYGFAEIERRATLGAEARYERWWTATIGFHVSVIGVLVPNTMVGPAVGARLGFPLGKKVTLFLEPGFAVFPLGTDLQQGNVILWAMLNGGVGVAL